MSKIQQRKFVFFLGAGASYAAGGTAIVQRGGKIPIPMQVTFWDTFLRFSKSTTHIGLIESFLFRYFLGFSRTPARLTPAKRRLALNGIDVEEVFTFLSERIMAPDTSISLRTFSFKVWHALVNEIPHVFARFKPNKTTRRIYRTFIRKQVRVRDSIVSFNYDTLFESSLQAGTHWHYEVIQKATKSRRLFKPHGSANWAIGDKISIKDEPVEAVVVAPTHLKFIKASDADSGVNEDQTRGYLDQSPQIQEVWTEMERQMRTAKALVFIGYSFPSSDLYFSSILRTILASRKSSPKIIIVNPNAASIEQKLRARFAIKATINYFDFASFAQITREQLLAEMSP